MILQTVNDQAGLVKASNSLELTGKVVDQVTLEPIGLASVTVVDENGKYLGDGGTTDEQGLFRLYSQLFPGNFLLVSHVQYVPATFPIDELDYYTVIGLDKYTDVLDEVVVTPQQRNTLELALASGLFVIGMSIDEHQTKRGKIGGVVSSAAGGLFSDPVVKYGTILVAGIVVFKVFGIADKILQWLGLSDSKATKNLDAQAEDPGSFWNPTMWQKGGKGTLLLTEAAVEAMITQIYDAAGWIDDNEEEMIAPFKTLKTQSQASYLAYKWQQKYKTDLLKWLRGGTWPKDRLSDADVNEITEYVNKLPQFTV